MRGPSPSAAVKEKGLTLEEVEAAEGTAVRESALGMAQTKRAAKRKVNRAGKAGKYNPFLDTNTGI